MVSTITVITKSFTRILLNQILKKIRTGTNFFVKKNIRFQGSRFKYMVYLSDIGKMYVFSFNSLMGILG
jgi:hypothetical protein